LPTSNPLEPYLEKRYIHTMSTELASIFKLGRAERLQLVEDLWDSIAQEEVSPAVVSDEKRDELRSRTERFLQHPATALSWDQVKQQARALA